MKLKQLLDIILKEEGVAETAGAYGFNISELQNFFDYYPNYERFKLLAFSMYNRKFIISNKDNKINNSNKTFENTIEPILKDFYYDLKKF